MSGWIKLHRKMKEHPRFSDSEWVHVWVWLMLSATHAPLRRIISGREVTIHPGQLITSRDSISKETGIHSSKVERVLKTLEIEQQIEQQKFSTCRVISITNWNEHQKAEQQIEQRLNSERTATEHTQEEEEHKKDTCIELPAGFPATEKQAINVCMSAGVPDDFIAATWNKAAGRGGRDAKDVPIRSFVHHVKTEWAYKRDRDNRESTKTKRPEPRQMEEVIEIRPFKP